MNHLLPFLFEYIGLVLNMKIDNCNLICFMLKLEYKILEDDTMNQVLVEICLRVRDIDATLDFYTNLFDFEIASRREFPEDKFDLIYLNSPGSSVQIELTYNYDADPYEIGDGFSHLGVTVNDLEKMHEVCKASDYETGDLRGLSGGTPSYFFVTDPDGYRIEVKREK